MSNLVTVDRADLEAVLTAGCDCHRLAKGNDWSCAYHEGRDRLRAALAPEPERPGEPEALVDAVAEAIGRADEAGSPNVAEAAIAAAVPDLSADETAVWLAHNRMNRRGVAVDRDGGVVPSPSNNPA